MLPDLLGTVLDEGHRFGHSLSHGGIGAVSKPSRLSADRVERWNLIAPRLGGHAAELERRVLPPQSRQVRVRDPLRTEIRSRR